MSSLCSGQAAPDERDGTTGRHRRVRTTRLRGRGKQTDSVGRLLRCRQREKQARAHRGGCRRRRFRGSRHLLAAAAARGARTATRASWRRKTIISITLPARARVVRRPGRAATMSRPSLRATVRLCILFIFLNPSSCLRFLYQPLSRTQLLYRYTRLHFIRHNRYLRNIFIMFYCRCDVHNVVEFFGRPSFENEYPI